MAPPGGNIQWLAAGQQSGKGGLAAFAIDAKGLIWENSQTSPGAGWTGWQGPGFQKQPCPALQVAVAGQNQGSLMLAMLDQQGMVWTIGQTGGSGSGWTAWTGPGISNQLYSFQSLSVGEQSGSHGFELWVTDFDGQIWTNWQTSPGGSWSGWQGPGFGNQSFAAAETAAAGQNNGDLILFALDSKGSAWAIPQGSASGNWGAWSGPNLAGQSQPFVHVAAAQQGGSRGVQCWTLDSKGMVWTLWQASPGGAWSSWGGPGFANQPAPFVRIAAAGQNDGDVLLLGVTEAGALWSIGQTSPGGDWGGWAQLPAPGGTGQPAPKGQAKKA
jgi:hypothetical protein